MTIADVPSSILVRETRPSLVGVSRKVTLDLYRTMLRIRRVEEGLIREYHPADEMRCPIHFCLGQEAPPAGVCLNLMAGDYVFSHHRSHGYYLAKGGSLPGMFAEFYGRATGSNGGKAGHQEIADHSANFHSGTILVGALPIAAGVAWTFQSRRQDNIAIAIFGDGGADEGTVYETLNFSALKKLPIVFICENNSYSTYSRQSARQPLSNLAERAEAFGVRARRIYGNDVTSVYRATREAATRARQGGGPTLLEMVTYRWCGHVGPEDDDHLEYRPSEELDDWKLRDPIIALEKVLLERGWIEGGRIESLEREIAAEIEGAFSFAKSSPFPGPEELMKDIFANDSSRVDLLKDRMPPPIFDHRQEEARLQPY